MADIPLVQTNDSIVVPAKRAPWLPIAIVAVALALLAAGAGWWFLGRQEPIPDWERLPQTALAAPAGDAFAADTPWAQMILAPLRPGEETALQVGLAAPRGTPVAVSAPEAEFAVSVQPISGEPAPPETLALTPAEEGTMVASFPADRAGWWRLGIAVAGAEEEAELYLLVPDPNINGPNAVPGSGSSAEGEALFQRGLNATAALQSVRFTQWIGDGKGNSSVAEHAVTAGGSGAPPGFTYRVTGGMEAVIIGETRWIRMPGETAWQEQEGAAVVLPSEWGEEYLGATGFTMLGEETIDGERCQLVAFVAPEQSEPRRRTVAWYLWWVGTESGQVRKEAMVSRVHYMLNEFSDFDEPITITPPDEAGTPQPVGTPAA